MKKLIITSILALLIAAGTTKAQNRPDEYLGLPGDNLNLYAVMKLFQESQTLEDFERKLNDENSRINNLDLNGDNLIDYIMVKDYPDGNVHNIVLQVALNQNEKQDVAVFTVQRFNNGTAQIQLIGDEALYGKNYIIEPIYADNSGGTPNPGYSGSGGYGNDINVVSSTGFDIAAWPLIRFMYLPGYVAWNSSWYWGYYPSYWHPWRPFFWDYYYGYHYNLYKDYDSHYHRWNIHRYDRWNDFYFTSRRSYSPVVYSRVQAGNFRATYSHPEQRKNGEAMFIKTHSDQGRRPVVNSSNNNQSVRSGSQSTRRNQVNNASNTTSRRSSITGTNTDRNASQGQNNNVTRRTTTTVNNGSDTRQATGQNVNKDQTSKQSTGKVVTPSNRRNSKNVASEKSKSKKKNKKTKEQEVKKDPGKQ